MSGHSILISLLLFVVANIAKAKVITAHALPLKSPNAEIWAPPVVYTTMSIGTPGIEFELQVDLDFEDALIVGTRCVSVSCRGMHNNRTIYDPNASSTAVDQDEAARILYGTLVMGEYYVDTVKVDSLSPTNVGFAVLSTANSRFNRVSVDGVFGLSFLGHTRGRKKLPSPVDSIMANASERIISMWFNRATQNADRYGIATFGQYNTEHCMLDTRYAKAAFDDYTFTVQKVRAGKFAAHRELNAKIDFNSQYLGLPTTVYKGLLNAMGFTKFGSHVDCDILAAITLDIKIGGIYYSLTSDDYSYIIDEDNNWCSLLISDTGEDFDAAYTLGEPFLRHFCITFDLDSGAVGFSSLLKN